MERPTSITLDVKYNADGTIDDNSLIMAIESALGGRLCITDWYGESEAANDYPHLSAQDRRHVINAIQTGDYDDAIDKDLKRSVIDNAVEAVGLEAYPEVDEDYHNDDSPMGP